jgi:drug/metabolite transporter (DMT)-like permease
VKSTKIAFIKALFAVIVWGASFIATKVALREVSPITVVWIRFGMGVIILGFSVMIQKQFIIPGWRDSIYFAFLGFLGITFHQWLQSNGLITAQASTTAWIVATTPIFIALFGLIFLREKIGRISALGILLAGLGVVLVMIKGDPRSLLNLQFLTHGDLLIIISAPNWAIFSVISRRGLQEHPAIRMIFFVMGFGWLFSSLLFFSGPGLGEITQITPAGWLAISFLGICFLVRCLTSFTRHTGGCIPIY